MERYFILDNKNTWYDWRLVLTAKDVTPPEPKTNNISLDGMNGTLDLSESLTGEVTYNDRTVTASFWTDEGSYRDREMLIQEITRTIHGKKIKIIEPDDPDHYFYGRVKIKSRKNILPYLEFTIEATCEPWRYSIEDFERTVEANRKTVTSVIIRNNGVKTICPDVTVTGSVNLSYNGVTTPLTEGTYKISNIKLYPGVNILEVSGSGLVTFRYKEGDL